MSANDQKRTTERERSGSPPKPPDIPVLARLGGLPGNIIPYRLKALRSNLVVSASGNDTCTVNECVALGFASRIDDARAMYQNGIETTSRTGDLHTKSELQAALEMLPI